MSVAAPALLASPSVAAAQAASAAVAASPDASAELGEIVVTARRNNERLQSVPVAVSVVTPAAIQSVGTFQPQDLPRLATGLSVAAAIGDRSNVTYSIRGQNQTYGTLFPAVIPYFAEVPVNRFPTGNFFDLDSIQVLRGPQGVLFGRVTDGGNVMVGPRRPSNDFGGYVEARAGNYGLHNFSGAVDVPIVSDKVLLRAAFEIDRRDGFTTNDFNGQKLDDVNSNAFRVSLILRPVDNVENYTVVQYQNIDNHGTGVVLAGVNPVAVNQTTGSVLPLFTGAYGLNAHGQVLPYQAGLTPLTPANYLASLQSQLAAQQARGPRHVYLTAPTFDRQHNFYLTNNTSVDITPDIQFKNIFGYVKNTEWESSYYSGDNSNLTTTCHSACGGLGGQGSTLPFFSQVQFSDEIRLAGKSFRQRLNWSLGAYADQQKPGQPFENDTINVGILERDNVQFESTWSKAVFGQAEYDLSDFIKGLKINGGYRYTEDRVKSENATYLAPIYGSPAVASSLAGALQASGLPAAEAALLANGTANFQIPYGRCVSTGATSVLGPFDCLNYQAKFVAHTWTGGASYELPSGQLVYAKVSRGYRPGGVNSSAPAGVSPQYGPEYDRSIEAGFKADWRAGDIPVRTNLAIFHDNYSNIQKQVVLPGAVPVSVDRNVAAAIVQGVEFEGTIKPTRDVTLALNYAYTDAHFEPQPSGGPQDPCSPESLSVVGFCTGNRLQNTPQNQFSFTADYRLPIDPGLGEAHFGLLWHYQSSVALFDSSSLNPNEIEPGYSALDLNATWSHVHGRPVDLSFFMTNLTNTLYRTGTDDLFQNSSVGTRSDIYAPPRMFGFSVRYHFGDNS
jgi:iron complex outermembrane receptor protein